MSIRMATFILNNGALFRFALTVLLVPSTIVIAAAPIDVIETTEQASRAVASLDRDHLLGMISAISVLGFVWTQYMVAGAQAVLAQHQAAITAHLSAMQKDISDIKGTLADEMHHSPQRSKQK